MTPYQLAWLVVVAAGIGGTALLFVATRRLRHPWLRSLIRYAPAVALMTPAPVPAYPDQIAPAFIVVMFEGLFQSEGAPRQALVILLAALVVLTLIVSLVHWRLRGSDRRYGTAADAQQVAD